MTKLVAYFLAAMTCIAGASMPAHAQSSPPAPPSEPASPQHSRAQQLMGDIAPKLADLTDTVLFGDVWARPQLSRRDRSLVTVSALIAMNRPDQLRSHLALARQNGLTEEELVEAITHLAFYAGCPNASARFPWRAKCSRRNDHAEKSVRRDGRDIRGRGLRDAFARRARTSISPAR